MPVTELHPHLEVIKEGDVLEDESSTGLKKYWRAFAAVDEDGNGYTLSEAWRETRSGLSAPVFSTPSKASPKNVGRSNATTSREQALIELDSAYNRKMNRKGYREKGASPEARQRLLMPMLAHRYDKHGHKITYPAAVQPKLDGHRCLMNGERAWTRTAKEHPPEIVRHLQIKGLTDAVLGSFATEGAQVILDGELMLPQDQFTFQESTKAIKKYTPELTPQLEYHVYDMIPLDSDGELIEMKFVDRINFLANLKDHPVVKEGRVRIVKTMLAGGEEDMRRFHAEFLAGGYEGTMVRNVLSPYKLKNRSYDLLKVKDFIDEEFTIIDVTDGVAKEEGCAIFVCTSHHADGAPFSVRPVGTAEHRMALYEERSSLMGKKLTVRYQELSDDGIPRFPVGVAVRDYD